MFLFKKKKKQIDFSRMPKHVAFIMDGNGRWAKKRGMPRNFGHKVGVESLSAVVKRAEELGIKIVSFYAFSTENWNRPKEEVDEIFRLGAELVEKKLESVAKRNIKLNISGDISKLPSRLKNAISACLEKTANNTGLVVNVCVNYGSRIEILRAVNSLIKKGAKDVDEKTFEKELYTAGLADPDLVVRTSGEQRLSNFMLWQVAYSEFYFPKVHWPDFRENELDEAIIEFQSRNRRFGGLKNK